MIDIKKTIRDVSDFPKKGIIFKDITTLLSNKEAFKPSCISSNYYFNIPVFITRNKCIYNLFKRFLITK